MLMHPQIGIKFWMEGGYKLIFLLGSNNTPVYFGKNLAIGRKDFIDVRSADKGHRKMVTHSFHTTLRMKTAKLAAISVTAYMYIHCGEIPLGEENHACTSAEDGKSMQDGIAYRFKKTELGKQTHLYRAFATGQHQSIFWLLPICELTYLKSFHAQLLQALLMLYESPLQGKNCYSHFPRSAISSSISCSLMPTIASPRSSLSAAKSLAS